MTKPKMLTIAEADKLRAEIFDSFRLGPPKQYFVMAVADEIMTPITRPITVKPTAKMLRKPADTARVRLTKRRMEKAARGFSLEH